MNEPLQKIQEEARKELLAMWPMADEITRGHFVKLDHLITTAFTAGATYALDRVEDGVPEEEDLSPFDNDPLHPVRTQKFGTNTCRTTLLTHLQALRKEVTDPRP